MNKCKVATVARKIHYAASKKRAICGLLNANMASDPNELTCRKCKLIIRRLLARPRTAPAIAGSRPPKAMLRKIGQQIQMFRNKIHMTRAQLARSCRISPGHLSRIEQGNHNVTLATFLAIATHLDTTLEILLKRVL